MVCSSSLRLKASWDSSRHEKLYLNRVTPEKERVYVTLSVVVEVWSLLQHNSNHATQLSNCTQPVLITKDLCLRLHSRDAKPTSSKSFWSFFGPKVPDSNKVTQIFQLRLHPVRPSHRQ